MKAVIYARYSSDNQREESIEGQLRECNDFAKKNDITVLRHYIDRAYSAKTDNRPETVSGEHVLIDNVLYVDEKLLVFKKTLDEFKLKFLTKITQSSSV